MCACCQSCESSADAGMKRQRTAAAPRYAGRRQFSLRPHSANATHQHTVARTAPMAV